MTEIPVSSSQFCDLHIHTVCSDGTETSVDIVNHAKELNLQAIAITDHDTMGGVKDALAEGRSIGVVVIPGIEFSVMSPSGPIHLLAYGISENDTAVRVLLQQIVKGRNERNVRILEKLRECGFPISYEELIVEAGNENIVGRPHIANLMLKKNYCSSFEEIYSKYLGNKGKAYVERFRPLFKDTLKIIHEAGGLAVLAHPGFYRDLNLTPLQLVMILQKDGLDGVECYYSQHTEILTDRLVEYCSKNNLLITGGSDYHGENKPHVQLGYGCGNLHVPAILATRLIGRIPNYYERFMTS